MLTAAAQLARWQDRRRIYTSVLILFAGLLAGPSLAEAQLPDLVGTTGKPLAKETGRAETTDTVAAPTADNPEATAASTAGSISIEKPVEDPALEQTLHDLLIQYPGVSHVSVQVRHGVVKLEGQIENEDVRNNVTQFTRRVEGVRLILNRMKTDAQMMTASQLAGKVMERIRDTISRNWLLVFLAVLIILAFSMFARIFNRYSETLLAFFVKNVLLRSVLGSLFSSLLILAGIIAALGILDLTQVVLSIVGLASIIGLAVGFAFRDITENFIASILLGMRRPFQVGDYVQVAGKAGIVRTLNTRATVLVTLEGNHVRIPNSTIFKEILVNSSASPSVRGTFDLMIPYDASTAAALDAITQSLSEQDGVLKDPPPRALVESLDRDGVLLRAYFWMPSRGIDGFKLFSDVKLRAKVALQKIGITPPPTFAEMTVVGQNGANVVAKDGTHPRAATPTTSSTRTQAELNLRRDSRAVAQVCNQPATGTSTPVEHVMNESESRVSEEGQNLIGDAESPSESAPAVASSTSG